MSFNIIVYSILSTSLIYNCMYGIISFINPTLAYYSLLFFILICSFCVRMVYFDDILNPMMKHSVSLLSSYLIVRGFSFCIGDYPDEIFIYELLIHREFEQAHRYFFREGYIYLIAKIILYISALFMNKITIKEVKEELENERYNGKVELLGELNSDNLIQTESNEKKTYEK